MLTLLEEMEEQTDFTVEEEPLDFNIITSSEFVELDISEQEDILSPWLKVGSICWISSNPSSLKTYFTLGLCQSIINGNRFGRFEVKKPDTKILYIDGELPESMFQERIRQLNLTNGENLHVLSKSVLMICPCSLNRYECQLWQLF